MSILIGLVGAAQIIFAFMYFNVAKSAVHEAVAVMLFGFGTLAIALAAILHRLNATPAQAALAPIAAAKGDLITIYKMYDIRREGMGVSAAGNQFADLDAAKAFIDQRTKGTI